MNKEEQIKPKDGFNNLTEDDFKNLSEEDKKRLQEEKPYTYLILSDPSLTMGLKKDEQILGFY